MARIKYIRVSTEGQNTARQEADLTEYDKVFTEKISGKNANRPQLQAMMSYVREGDIVTVDSYSRFARNTLDLLTLVQQLNDKGVAFQSLKENIDTTTPTGKLFFHISASIAEFERDQMLERQREGIAAAKAAGKYKGRKRISVDAEAFKQHYEAVKAGKQTAVEAMRQLNLKPNTYYRRVKEYENTLNR